MSSELELTNDLEDLQKLRSISTRPRVQTFLDAEIKKVTQDIQKVRSDKKSALAAEASKAAALTGGQTYPTKKITTFAFDESDKFVKLYYTLDKVQSLPKESISSTFTDNSFQVYVQNLNGVNYVLEAKDLTDYIDAEKSVVKQKSDCVLVMLKKIKEGSKWEKLLALEKKPSADVPSFDDGADPQASMMKMMKKMYDEGDDEMKRTLTKSMYESQQKSRGGGGDFEM